VSALINKKCDDREQHFAHVWQYLESSDPDNFQAFCHGQMVDDRGPNLQQVPPASDEKTYVLGTVMTGRYATVVMDARRDELGHVEWYDEKDTKWRPASRATATTFHSRPRRKS
jgi:hypothetical protein